MAMSRQHYVALANVLGESGVSPDGLLIININKWLQEDNPRFDEEKFVQAVATANRDRATKYC